MTRLASPVLALALAVALAGCGAGSADPPPDAPSEPSGVELPATAVIVCGADGATVETPRVAASRDGVHLEIRNESGARRVVHVQAADSAQGEGFPQGVHARVWALPPGAASVTCDDPARGPGDEPGERLQIADPDGVWVSTELDCEDIWSATLDYLAGAPGIQGEPAEAVRAASEVKLDADDVVELAGYPDAEESPAVRVVRDGSVVSVASLMPAEDGGWLVSTVTRCAGG